MQTLPLVAMVLVMTGAHACGSQPVPECTPVPPPQSLFPRYVPAPYRYMPDRQVQGERAVGEAVSWAPSTQATVLSHGPFVLDQGALLGLDDEVRQNVIGYVGAVLDRIAVGARPPRFEQWTLREGHSGRERCGGGSITQWFPSNFETVKAGSTPVPIKIYPSAGLVRSAVGGQFSRLETESIEQLAKTKHKIGRTLVYEHGALKPSHLEGMTNGGRLFRILPLATPAISRSISAVAPMLYAPQYGRLVVPNTAAAWAETQHALSPSDTRGRRSFGEIHTIELIPEVYLRRVIDAKGKTAASTTLVFELWDGLGGIRCNAASNVDPLAVPAIWSASGGGGPAKLGHHDLLRVPVPLARSATEGGISNLEHPQERFVIDEAWAASDPPIVVVRKGDGWEPYCETLVIDSITASASVRDGSLLMIGVFSNATPEQLVELLAAFGGVESGPIKADGPFMQHIQVLFDRLNPKP